jgi:hypothetical protein
MASGTAPRPADVWLGPGFWKLAYLIRDREGVIEQLRG